MDTTQVQTAGKRLEERMKKREYEGREREIEEARQEYRKFKRETRLRKKEMKGKKIRKSDMVEYENPHYMSVRVVKHVCKGRNIEVLESGWPDMILVREGKIVFVEVKTGEYGKLSKAQIRMREVVERAGLRFVVVNDRREGVRETIEREF